MKKRINFGVVAAIAAVLFATTFTTDAQAQLTAEAQAQLAHSATYAATPAPSINLNGVNASAARRKRQAPQPVAGRWTQLGVARSRLPVQW